MNDKELRGENMELCERDLFVREPQRERERERRKAIPSIKLKEAPIEPHWQSRCLIV